MSQTPLEQFKSRIEAHLIRTGQTPTAFGLSAVRCPNFVFDLRNKGRCPTMKTVDRVLRYIDEVERGTKPRRGQLPTRSKAA